jgi:hypothetical protein
MAKDPRKKPANVGAQITVSSTPAQTPVPFIPTQGGVRPGGAPGPSQWQDPSDSISQWIRPGVSQVRFPALPTKANIQSNSTSSSITRRQIAPVAAQTVANTTAIQNLANQSIFLGNWSPSTTYQVNNQVLYSGGYYICLALNLNQEPDTHPASWQLITNQNSSVYEGPYSSLTTYQSGETVSFQGGFWVALNTTTGNAPSTSSSHWTLLGASSVLTGTWGSGASYVPNMQVVYPAGGNMWTCLVANVNKQPDINPTYWQLVGPSDLDFIADGTIYIKGIGTVASESVLVPNNNFEASAALPVPGWTANNNATLSYLTSGQQSGNQSLGVYQGTAAGNAYAQTITVYACKPGDEYLIGGYAKSDGTGVPYIMLRNTATGAIIGTSSFGTGTTWTYNTATVTIPSGWNGFSIICLNGSASSGNTAYYDNIYCVKIAQLGSQVAEGPTQFFQSSGSITYRPTSNPLTATDAGGSATVNCAAFTLATTRGNVSYNSGSVTGLSYSTQYYIYFSDPGFSGGSPTYLATTTKTTAIGTGDIFVGSIRTPAAGAQNTSGNSDGGVGASAGSTAAFGFNSAVATTTTNATITNPQNAIDGNTTTDAVIKSTSAVAAADGVLTISGGPALLFAPFNSLTLYVLSSAPSNTAGNNITVSYSLNGGSSYTTIWTVAGSSRALTLDSINLPVGQNLGLVQVKCEVQRNNGTGNIGELDVYEVYVIGLQ